MFKNMRTWVARAKWGDPETELKIEDVKTVRDRGMNVW